MMERRTMNHMRNPLLLPDLLPHILDYLVAPNTRELDLSVSGIRVRESSTVSRKALFALAQTCRALSEPALDRLWHALGSLEPLIRCFAEVAYTDTAMTPPSPAEWAIIRRYAVRVRELNITEAPGDVVSLYFLQNTLLQPLDRIGLEPIYLFPNLRTLVWNPPPEFYAIPLLERLLTPGLVSLDVTLEGRVDVPSPLFEYLAYLCPNLKTLRWDFGHRLYEPIVDIVDALSSSVLCLRKIEGLELFAPLDPVTLKYIILSPDFKALGIGLDHVLSEVEQVDITPTDTPFPNVETIELEIGDLDILTSLLRPHQQKFRNFTFKIHSGRIRPLVQPMFSCFTALATPQRVNSIQSLTFALHADCARENDEGQYLEDSPVSYCLTYETLLPLASFRCLRELAIVLHNQISIDDNELAMLARSWPSLEALQLACRSGGWPWTSAKYPTLRGLLALIEACPQLWTVSLPIDARIVPTDTNPDICNPTITYVEFPDAYISDPRSVAFFFRVHLPSVEAVNTGCWLCGALRGGDTEYLRECQRLWREVEDLL